MYFTIETGKFQAGFDFCFLCVPLCSLWFKKKEYDMQEELQRRPFYIDIPDFAVIVLVGVSGSGKSTFARTHFKATEILSSDGFRGMVCDDENDQAATTDAFDALHYVAGIRLRNRKLVAIDATNVQPDARKPLLNLAHSHDALAVAIVLDVPEAVCAARNSSRSDRQFGPHVIRNQSKSLRQSIRNLKKEGFRYVFTLNPAQIEDAQITRIPTWTDRRNESGPFDLIGDVHGCYDELIELLTQLNYAPNEETGAWAHPLGRRVVFLGDLVDRGPKVVETVRLAQKNDGGWHGAVRSRQPRHETDAGYFRQKCHGVARAGGQSGAD